MKFLIKHDIKGRNRVQMCQTRMSFTQADMLQYYLEDREYIHAVKIQVRTQGVVIQYEESARAQVIDDLRAFGYDRVTVPESYLEKSGRELNQEYWDKLVNKVIRISAINYSCHCQSVQRLQL